MTPISLFHRYACFVPCVHGAPLAGALEHVTCFDCALQHGLVDANSGRYSEAMLAAVPRNDPGGGGVGAALANGWRTSRCSRCRLPMDQCDLNARHARMLLPEGWSPDRDSETIRRIDDRDAFLAVGRLARELLGAVAPAEAWEFAARMASADFAWALASEEDRLRAVGWVRGLAETPLPNLVAVWAQGGSDLERRLREARKDADESGLSADFVAAGLNGTYLDLTGWHIIPRSLLPGCLRSQIRRVAWSDYSWIIGTGDWRSDVRPGADPAASEAADHV